MNTDTIVAIATAASDSGIGIVRISGDTAIKMADKIYHSKNGKKHLRDVNSHTIHYGFIYDKEELIDEVMVVVMKAPNTYTREDIVEIDCHGGVLVMHRILDILLRAGCRLAQPGEFTKRAFLNGRIDLSKAEAVMDIIHSKSEFALKASVRQLHGVVSDQVKKLRADILYEIAFIESALDDPEHVSLEGYCDKLQNKIKEIQKILKRLLDSCDSGKMVRDGINTVIVGKPNAGKSSLLNLLVGEERAIVTHIAGTTRDALEESIKVHGIGFNIIDTAGVRDTEDEVEKIGVAKTKDYAQNADLILYVVDASRALDENDRNIIDLIADKKIIVLLNKMDLDMVICEEDILRAMSKEMCQNSIQSQDETKKGSNTEDEIIQQQKDKIRIIRTSAKENVGIDAFEQAVKEMFFGGEIAVNDEIYITNQRHKEALCEAYESIQMVTRSLMDHMPEDFYSIDLTNAYIALGKILGEEVGDDVVEEIFGKFCVGK